MKIMSMNSGAYSLSYWISQFIFVTIMSVIIFLALWLPTKGMELPNDYNFVFGSGLILGTAVLLFGSALLSVSMMISSFFTDSKLSA